VFISCGPSVINQMVQLCNYSHRDLDQEITAIGGHYVFTKEGRIAFRGRQVFYLSGYTLLDSACCGAGGYGYALVQGFVEKWRYTTDTDGYTVSRIETISDLSDQKEIRLRIYENEMVWQVGFRVL